MDIKIEYVPLSEVVGADSNPKDHDIGQIYQSIKRFGFTSPVMMNKITCRSWNTRNSPNNEKCRGESSG